MDFNSINSFLINHNHYFFKAFPGYSWPQTVALEQSLLQYEGISKISFGIGSYEYVFMIKSSVLYPVVLIFLGILVLAYSA